MSCLKVEIEGVITDITPRTFKYQSLKGAKVISGEKYYIDKALSLGAIAGEEPEIAQKKKPKRKTKE